VASEVLIENSWGDGVTQRAALYMQCKTISLYAAAGKI